MNNVIGHEKQKEFLTKVVLNKKIPHAFLFAGEDMVGKKTLAFAFAKLIFLKSDTCARLKLKRNRNIRNDSDLFISKNRFQFLKKCFFRGIHFVCRNFT